MPARSRCLRLLALFVTSIAVSCRSPDPGHPPGDATSPSAAAAAGQATNDPNAQLDRLAAAHIEATWRESPTLGTWMGAHRSDARLDDVSRDALRGRMARIETLRASLDALPVELLNPRQRIDHVLLDREVRVALYELRSDRGNERNPTRYASLIAAALLEPLLHEELMLVDRLRLVTSRLAAVRPVLDEARRALHSPPELLTRRALDLGQSTRSFVSDTLPRIVSALSTTNASDETLVVNFRAAQTQALRALEEWCGWLQKELLPRSKGELALGRDRLVEMLAALEMLDVPLEQVQSAAERELGVLRRLLEETARLSAPGKGPLEAIRLLDEDHPRAEDLLSTAARQLEQVVTRMREQRFAPLPDVALKVAEMPPYLWGGIVTTPAGTFESRPRDGWLYVEPIESAWDDRQREEHLRALSRTQLLLTILHQAVPGHFLAQHAFAHAPSMLEKLVRSDAFVEGWADYATETALAQWFSGDVQLRLGLLRDQLVRLCRLLAVLRFHAAGARLDELPRLFTDFALLDEHAARREAERAAADPKVLLPALGRLQLLKLRDDYRLENGAAFRLSEFHARLLVHGALPVVVLRRILLFGPVGRSL